MEFIFCLGPIDATPEFRLRKIPDSWLLRLWRCVADTRRGKGTGSCAGRLKRCILYISIYIYMYTCKTPSEWWLGRSTIIRHGSRRFQGITQESTRVDRCLDWRAASQASRGAVLRSAGDLCFLVVLVITSPLKSNMETKSKGLEDSFLLEPFYCGVCMGVEAFPRTRQSGGRLRWYGYIYISDICYIYIYDIDIYIYEFQSYCIHTCIVHPFAEAIPNCLIYLGDVATFAVLPAFEPLGHAGYPMDIWIGFPWLCNLTPTVVGVISRLMSPTAPPSWLEGWNGWLWILHVSISSPQGRCRTLRSLFWPHQQVKHWSSMFVMSLCDITSRTSRFELAFVQGTVIIWYNNIIIWFHLMCNIIFNTYSAIIYHHLQCPVRQSVSSARSFWLTSKMVKHWQLKQVAPCDWCSSDQGTLRGGTKIGTNFIDLENTAEFPLYDLWVHSCPFILWEFMTIHDHSWPFMREVMRP